MQRHVTKISKEFRQGDMEEGTKEKEVSDQSVGTNRH